MFRFTIRDVLWLTVVVALALGWWLDRSKLETTNRELTKEADAKKRIAELRQRELDFKVILERE